VQKYEDAAYLYKQSGRLSEAAAVYDHLYLMNLSIKDEL